MGKKRSAVAQAAFERFEVALDRFGDTGSPAAYREYIQAHDAFERINFEEVGMTPPRHMRRVYIPDGPWYGLAWASLPESVRVKLENYTRKGKYIPCRVNTPTIATGEPDKMPGPSWAMEAGTSCPGAVFGTGTICEWCYASGGQHRKNITLGEKAAKKAGNRGYAMRPHVVRANKVRFFFAKIASVNPQYRQLFVDTMVAAIRDNPHLDGYFRIHDAGDFFSPSYVSMWRDITAALPDVQFWAPTRSWHLADPHGKWAAAFTSINALPNVTIRPSALRIEDAAPSVPGFAAGSGVKVEGYNCPASTQNNQCGSCRSCWDDRTKAIYYHAH